MKEMLLVFDMIESKNNLIARIMRLFLATIALFFSLNANGQIRKGYISSQINEEYLTLISYFSHSPVERISFAERYYVLEDMGMYTPAIIKYDLDGLSGWNSPEFLGVGFTGPNIILKDSMLISIERWRKDIPNSIFEDSTIVRFPIFSDSSFSLYQFLIEYCKNRPCQRVGFIEEMLEFSELNILLIFLIKTDLDSLCGVHTSWITEDNLRYINLQNLEQNISIWKNHMSRE